MKLLILTLVAAAYADVSHILNPNQNAKIVSQELDVSPDGTFKWQYETDNGINAQQQGQLVPSADGEAVAAQGAFSWTSPEGERIDVQYVADENGYQPQGAHLPTPPPIPEAIVRALEYIRAHPPPPEHN